MKKIVAILLVFSTFVEFLCLDASSRRSKRRSEVEGISLLIEEIEKVSVKPKPEADVTNENKKSEVKQTPLKTMRKESKPSSVKKETKILKSPKQNKVDEGEKEKPQRQLLRKEKSIKKKHQGKKEVSVKSVRKRDLLSNDFKYQLLKNKKKKTFSIEKQETKKTKRSRRKRRREKQNYEQRQEAVAFLMSLSEKKIVQVSDHQVKKRRTRKQSQDQIVGSMVMLLPSKKNKIKELLPEKNKKKQEHKIQRSNAKSEKKAVKSKAPIEKKEEKKVSSKQRQQAKIIGSKWNNFQKKITPKSYKNSGVKWSKTKIEVLDSTTGESVPACIRFSTSSSSDWKWQEKPEIYTLEGGVYHLEVDAGFNYYYEKLPMIINQKNQRVIVRVHPWNDFRSSNWRPMQLYTYSREGDESLSPREMKNKESVLGLGAWALEHPFYIKSQKSSKSIELSYEALFDMTLDYHGSKRIWLATQRQILGQVSLDILGAYKKQSLKLGESEAYQFVDLSFKARQAGATLSLLRPSGYLKLGKHRVKGADLAFFSGALVDVVDLQSEDDYKTWIYLMKQGIVCPALRSHRQSVSLDKPNPWMFVRGEKGLSQKDFLEKIKDAG